MLITGGEEATPHEYPWMAALFFEQGSGNTYFCGGTLVMFMIIDYTILKTFVLKLDFSQISDEWVMTAAHCVAGATSMKVYLGAHNVREVEVFILINYRVQDVDPQQINPFEITLDSNTLCTT